MGSIFLKKEAKREAGDRDPDSESMDSLASMQLMAERLKKRDPRKELALKAGFVSLQERLGNWARQASASPTKDRSSSSTAKAKVQAPASHQQHYQKHHHQQTGQFATLQEFFQSKSSLRKQLEQDELLRKQRRPRVPIMKLTKEDWNVKCWEERFSKARGQSIGQASKENHHNNNNNNNRTEVVQPNRAKKLERQVEVFHGRIDEVAKKLDKVREGAPLDEQLHKLRKNKLREPKREHSWTDMLKSELTEGVHNAKLLRSKLQSKLDDTFEDGADSASITSATTNTTTMTTRRRIIAKSPLGRPIGRIDQDDDDDDDVGGGTSSQIPRVIINQV